jgi:hypothetical protein
MIRRDKTDPSAPTTFFELANAGIALEEAGGRFSAASRVVGSTPTAAELYPAPGVPNADVGEELPVGDDQRPEPVGTAAEITASIERERSGDA